MDIELQTQDFKGDTASHPMYQYIRIYKCFENTVTCLTDGGQGLYSESDVISGQCSR